MIQSQNKVMRLMPLLTPKPIPVLKGKKTLKIIILKPKILNVIFKATSPKTKSPTK